jgi:hypothetical protein
MITLAGVALLLQAGAAAPASAAQIPVQMGVTVTSDTVTVGERFIAVIKVRAPAGSTIDFPTTVDSAAANSLTGMELIGKPAIQTLPGTDAVTMSAAYRLTAWDTGPQRISLTDIVVHYNGQTGYVSVADRGVFVRSVLPEDSTLRVPKPPRPAITTTPFNWLPWLIALAALVAAGLLWRLWIWYRNRSKAPVDPYTAAQREFDRIEAMNLIQSGESPRHAALMSDVMRDYLAARVPEIERSHTSTELLAAGVRVHSVAKELGELLWRSDLVKFARADISATDADALGKSARHVVQTVEDYLVGEEEKAQAKAAA